MVWASYRQCQSKHSNELFLWTLMSIGEPSIRKLFNYYLYSTYNWCRHTTTYMNCTLSFAPACNFKSSAYWHVPAVTPNWIPNLSSQASDVPMATVHLTISFSVCSDKISSQGRNPDPIARRPKGTCQCKFVLNVFLFILLCEACIAIFIIETNY